MQLLAGACARRAVLSGSLRLSKRKLHSRLGTAVNLTSTAERSDINQLFSVAVAALSPGSSNSPEDVPGISKPVKEAEKRVLRLELLLCLRRLYRNIVRAEAYHRTAAHVYTPLTDAEVSELATEEDRQEEREARRSDALDILADMAVIKEQIQADIKEILPHTALLFAPPGSQVPPADPLVGAAAAPQWAGDAAPRPQSAGRPRPKPTKPTPQAEHAAAIASDLDSLASRAVEKLRYRGERELDRLASAFQYQPQLKILDREVQSRAVQMGSGLSVGAVPSTKYLKGAAKARAPVAAARDFVRESGVKAAFRASRSYVTDFWARINGLRLSTATESLPFGMPTPCGRAGVIWPRVQALQERITELERHLKESSKAREQRVRRAPLELRATMAYEMQDMDRDVLRVGRELALCTLDVQLDALYLTLEEEVRQILDVEADSEITGKEPAAELAQAAQRRGSTEELSVLIAQYSLLVRRQASLRDVFQRQEQRLALLMPAFDEEVRALAEQISESRLRVGIPDQDVFGGSGFSMRKLQLQMRDASVSVRDGVDFFVLGVRMLVTDVGYSGRLFGRATIGVTLKSREVSAQIAAVMKSVSTQALRRTLKDILTFVPFIIILIIPMTPLGHVLVFGFIQRYFPDFFPSQFNQRRQEMVKTYEELRQRLQLAQAAANHEEDQENLQQAAAAIARLTPPSVPVVLDGTQEPSGNNMMTILPNSISSAPDELKELRRRVEQAGFEAMNFDTESEDEERDSTKNLPDSWKIR